MDTIELVPQRLLTSARSLYELNGHPHHNWLHILSVCGELDAWSADACIPIDLATALGTVGHDIIYEARRGSRSEERSVVLFTGVLEAHDITDPAIVARVGELIMFTDGHHDPAPDDILGAALVDADYAILGQSPDVYRDYSQAIRTEWRRLSDAEFNQGRRAFLSAVLARRQIFRTNHFKRTYERQARDNIGLELASLPQGGAP